MRRQSVELSSWIFSLAFHASLVAAVLGVIFFQNIKKDSEPVSFDVIINPTSVSGTPRALPENLRPITPAAPKIAPPTSRAVYGLSKKAITTNDPGGIEVKSGNTIAKAEDKLVLTAGDAEALPIPTDEYMVSKMPSISREIRAPYPPDAKSKRIQGIVSLELLIDLEGTVRQVKLLEGPGFGLNEAAANAAAQFLFEPARVGTQPVAVMIRYNYKFILE